MNRQTGVDRVRVFAPAKINLFLHVGTKRADGYHDLQSLVVFAEAGDDLTLAKDETLSLSIDGPFAGALSKNDDNLVLRAVRSLASAVRRPAVAEVRLTKNLPVASGIGGGSADAAATLRGLRWMWGLAHPGDDVSWGHRDPFANCPETYQAAIGIGSDVPVCLLSAPAFMEGRGERVWSLGSFPGAAMVLINPGVAVSTADVFRKVEKRTGAAEMIPSGFGHSLRDLLGYLTCTHNDLEPPALAVAPCIGDVLASLRSRGAVFARMSGSGATCFGLFETSEDAESAAADIRKTRPDWWVCATRIASRDIGRPRPAL